MRILPLLSAQLIIATFAQAAIFFDPDAVKHSCVNDDGSTLAPGVPVHLTDIDTTYDEQIILLKPITPDTTITDSGDGITHMCVFHRWTLPIEDKDAKKGFYFPLGRSMPSIAADYVNFTYGSDGDWTRPPGKGSRQVEYVCGEAGNSGPNFAQGEYLCEVTLPMTSKYKMTDPTVLEKNDPAYFLAYYNRNMTVRNELSRFLQKNTFGPTSDELDALEAEFEAILAGPSSMPSLAPTISNVPSESPSMSAVPSSVPTGVPSGSITAAPSSQPSANGTAADSTAANTTTANTTTTRALQEVANSNSTTYGPTHAEAMKELQTNWVARQMDPSTFSSGEFSSLRAYWRRRLNPRKEETYRIGESGPHPCETNSRWRKFAFTSFDAQNSMTLRWGTSEIGGSYGPPRKGHRITVEEVEYWGPAGQDDTTLFPSSSPTSGDASVLALPSPSQAPSLSMMPSLTNAPTSTNLLTFGGMEGTLPQIKNQWPSRCSTALVNAADGENVYEGNSALHLTGGINCFLFRPIAPTCTAARITDPIVAGDTLFISLKVRIPEANQIFQMYTGHYHTDKSQRRWGLPDDDSYMVSRTLIEEADTWTHITAIHKVGPDWTFQGGMLVPQKCNHYHLRFRVANSNADLYIDDVHVSKVSKPAASADASTNSTTERTGIDVPTAGFFTNPNFDFEYQFWKYAPNTGHIIRDRQLKRNVMALRRNNVLSQNVIHNAVPGQQYQFGFKVRLAANMDSLDMRIMMRLRFSNNDLANGPCHKSVCNFFERPLAKNIAGNGGEWQTVVTEKFDMFDGFMDWDGNTDFILFQLFTRNMDAQGEYYVTDFGMYDGGVYTDAPSESMVPSMSPTNMFQEYKGYIVRYAGEIRTVIRYPFQIDKTGEQLNMNGTEEFRLCEVDEVEGRKAEFPNRMNFYINQRCQPIRHGNPTVDLDFNFINANETLHMLDLSANQNINPINVDQTYGGDWLLGTAVQDDVCPSFPTPYDNDYRGGDPSNPDALPSRFEPDKPVFAKLPDGSYALYDSRLILHGNTLESPLMDGGGSSVLRSTLRSKDGGLKTKKYPWAEEYYMINDQNIALCINEQPNFLNREHCVLSYDENVCVKEYLHTTNTLNDVQLVVTFNDDTLARFHNATSANGVENSRYLYAVDNLRWDATVNPNITAKPCMPNNPVSRWKTRPDLTEAECTNNLNSKSNTAFEHALETSNDENPNLRDIYLWNDKAEDGCDEVDYDQYGMLVMTTDGCWENMHPDYMSIYDFTAYEADHDQTSDTTYIGNWTEVGIMQYPDNLPTSYFEELKETWGKIKAVERYSYASTSRVNQGARYGDSIILDQFAEQMNMNNDPIILKSIADNLAEMKLANQVAKNRGGGTLVCGSPNEVEPDPTLDDYFDVVHRDMDCIGCQDSYGDYDKQKVTVWAMNALEGEDQLCQRMAWSLYELLNVGTASNQDNTESNLYTYDIFLRHCFGTYFDILKEMTFTSKMGEQFNYVDSASTRLSWDSTGTMVFPDENYAREIMQLFTIGLHELNPDGTETRDEHDIVTQTYTNADIMSNSRIFTGFVFSARRGNVEELFRSEKARIDPLRIEVDRHDYFPKSSVDGNWIGDRYPLCVDLPKDHFLKIGAKYHFRGSSSLPRVHQNPPHWDSDESIKRFVLDPNSGLYEKLCSPGVDGACNFAQTVTLDSNLVCYGKECRVDNLEVIQVTPGAFFEYIRQPCVDLSFYDNPKKVISGFAPWIRNIGRRHTHAMCADPRAAVAARACCGISSENKSDYNYDFEYHGEKVFLATNIDQCVADGGTVCDPNAMRADNPLVNIRPVYNHPYPSRNTFFWTDASCTQSVKIRQDGLIAIINTPHQNPFFHDDTVPFVDLVNTVNYFSVTWERDPWTFAEIYPSLDNSCGNSACSITSDDACLCSVVLSETPAFNSLPSKDDVLSLKIGAFDPESFSDSDVTYSILESSDDVEAYVSSDSTGMGATSTIFKVVDEYGDVAFFKNMESTITLGSNTTTYELRNPPSFINLVKVELRDVEYEVDAFLMHLIRYPSAAPFISKKLIQYHGISNPSPGFVHRVTQAFISGSFTSGGVTFGNDKYGDLKAVAAAISLDPESLSPVVDEDPSTGNIREPLLKLIQFMRSLSFKRRPHVKFRHGLFEEMSAKMGQMVFDPPDQFSFFSSDYSPPGVFAETEMVSPESELLSMSSVVGLINGFFSFVSYGLAYADGGFGPPFNRLPPVGDTSTSVGYLTFPYQTNDGSSVTSKIDELSTMMTAGRLSAENKQVLVDAHIYFNQTYGIDFADRVLLKLLATTPEFHTTNTVRKTGSQRPFTPPATKSSSLYKAIVYISLSGGADSFNILTPGSSDCTLYDEYFEARGGETGIGLITNEILNIDASSAGIEGCSTFGVNSLLPAYKDIFDEGKGVFFANMGHLHKPVTKENWLAETRTDLFSHHAMRQEAHVVDAFREGEGPGVLGRMLDVLERQGHAVGAASVNSRATIIDGSPMTGRLSDIMSPDTMPRVFDRNFLKDDNQQLREYLEAIHAETNDNSGFFGNAWSQTFVDMWNKTDALVTSLRANSLATTFPTPSNTDIGGIASQLKLVAKLIALRDERGNGINRDVFYCEMGGYDAHFKVNTVMESKLPSLDHAVASFWAEIKAQGMENNVVVVQGSEFGRTITPNSNQGSDHAWGGNYFMFGGDVKGGKIMGKYPESFSEADPTNVGRGRLIPTTSWDALFYALTQWMGITDQDDIDYVLPNNQNFGCNLFTDYDLFNTGQQVLNGCGGSTLTQAITFQVPDIRKLTGEEQKDVCRLAVRALYRQMQFDRSHARCYVSDMTISDSEIAPGNYDLSAIAVLNFDDKILPSAVTPVKIAEVTKSAATAGSDFAVLRAIPQSEAPSQTPSVQPSVSALPTMSPSLSSMPSTEIRPSGHPSSSPTLSSPVSYSPTRVPTFSPTHSFAPNISLKPTDGETPASLVFGLDFLNRDIGGASGQTGALYESESEPGLYTVEGNGNDMYNADDEFHYAYVETSGDVTFTVLIEGRDASEAWAKGGIMFRDSLSASASHYSLLLTGDAGLANQFRNGPGSDTQFYGNELNPDSVWLRVVKQGNRFWSYYKAVTSKTSNWISMGAILDIPTISSNGYYVGIAVSSYTNSATASYHVSNVQLTRACGSTTTTTTTELQCLQASNCDWGEATGTCYSMGSVPYWESSEPVESVFDIGSTVTTFGCYDSNEGNWALDGTTTKYQCDRTGMLNEPTGLVITPSHQRLSIAEGLRVYASNNCPNCDPVSYIIEGRTGSTSNWVQISQGDLLWKALTLFPRNGNQDVDIGSSYTDGDGSLKYTEVSFYNPDFVTCGTPSHQRDYRGTISTTASGLTCQSWSSQSPHGHTRTDSNYPSAGLGGNHNYCRNPDNSEQAWCYTEDDKVRWEYCDVPDCEEDPATLGEFMEYKITWTGTRVSNQVALRFAEIEVPGLLGEEPALPTLGYAGDYVASVVHGSTDITILGAVSQGATLDQRALDDNTNKFFMYKQDLADVPGMRISPSHGRSSVVTGLRIYTANNNPGADPVQYSIEGRESAAANGANILTRHNGKCWNLNTVSDGFTVELSNRCEMKESDQVFYMNDLGEIRAKSLPGKCMDPRYGVMFGANYFVDCLSEAEGVGPTHPSARTHYFTFDLATEQFESVLYPGKCVEFRPNTGQVTMDTCSTATTQKFYANGGQLMSGADWTLIQEGHLPWVSGFDRNPTGQVVQSTYENGDTNKYYMEVKFFENTTPFYEYKILFPALRDPQSVTIQFSELELPGLLLGEA